MDNNSQSNQELIQTNYSPWCKFHMDLQGYDLYFHGRLIHKWEAWGAGFRDARKLINNKTNIKAVIARLEFFDKPEEVIDETPSSFNQ